MAPSQVSAQDIESARAAIVLVIAGVMVFWRFVLRVALAIVVVAAGQDCSCSCRTCTGNPWPAPAGDYADSICLPAARRHATDPKGYSCLFTT